MNLLADDMYSSYVSTSSSSLSRSRARVYIQVSFSTTLEAYMTFITLSGEGELEIVSAYDEFPPRKTHWVCRLFVI